MNSLTLCEQLYIYEYSIQRIRNNNHLFGILSRTKYVDFFIRS